jgi:RNA polymerase sigma factor (sigma-70 family)
MTQPPPLIDALRRLAGSGPDGRSDAELLAEFVARRDPGAFAALVHRYGRLVWGACRRRARDSHTAEDAFQTTFLALARHAAAVRRPEAVGAWLHRVAVRCTAAARTPREPMSALPEDLPTHAPGPAAAAAGRDLERVIDAEIDALPEPFRLTFVLCEVEERSTAEAASALGCPVGTVESRLTRARERLRARLARRGITAGALIGLGLAADAVPATARAAAVAQGTGAAPVPLARAVLADRAVRPPLAGATVSGIGLARGALLVGMGGLVWALASRPDIPGPTNQSRLSTLPVPDLAIPEAEQFRRNRQNFPLPPEAIARIGDAWLRHAGSPDRLAFSADGRFLASGAVGDRWLRVWDLTARRPRAHLRLGPGEIPVAVTLTPDGGILRAVIQAGDVTYLREYDTFRALETHRRTIANATSVAFDATGSLLAVTMSREVRLIHAATAVERWRAIVSEGESIEVAFGPRDRLAVLATGTDRVRLYDLGSGTPVDELVEAGTKMTLPTISADGRTMAVWLPLKNRVRVWDLAEHRIVHTIVSQFPLLGLAVAPDGSRVAGFTEWSGGALWDARVPSEPRWFGSGVPSHVGLFSADGSVLAVATIQRATYDTQQGVIQLINPKTGQPTAASPAEPNAPVPLAFRPDGGRVLLEGMMRWLDYPTFGDDPPQMIAPGFPADLCWSAAGDRAALSPDRTLLARANMADPKANKKKYVLELVDMATRLPRNSIPLDSPPLRPAFAPDGRTVYAVVGKKVHGWDVASGRPVFQSNQPVGQLVYRLLVSADGRYLATALLVLAPVQQAGSIQVWDVATGECVISAEAFHGRPFIAFSADGKRFAAAAVPDRPVQHTSEVRVWDLETRQVTATFPHYDGQPAFSPDGRMLAITLADAVVLIEFASGHVRHVFRHHGPVRHALAWQPDGRVLASASREAPVYLWDVVGDRTGATPAWDVAENSGRWDALAGVAAVPAFGAVRELWTHPTEAAAFLRSRVPADADARLACRACEALELPATPAGKDLLKEWAAGKTDAPRTKEAAAALRRLAAAGGGGRG